MNTQKAREFIETHYRKNRTIVSSDISGILDDVEKTVGLPLIRHRFASGEEHSTWIIPPQWDVREAWIKDANGQLLASYRDHPLFVAPYSKAIHSHVSKDELLRHIFASSHQLNAFAYNHRLAYNAKLRLKDWCLSLPQNHIAKLGDGPFEVFIDVDVKDGEMLVGEIALAGEHPDTIAFLADWCHPGQVNDSFSGLVVFMEIMRALALRPQRRYSYKMLMFPETIGSSVFIGSDPTRVRNIRGALFSEMVGWGKEWFLKGTRTGASYMDQIACDCRRKYTILGNANFFSLYGNDEYVFDSVQVGIPTLSLQKYPFDEYHTSNDNPIHLRDDDLRQAYEIIMHIVEIVEKDDVFEFVHPVPFYMSRYDLYADAVYESDAFYRNREIQFCLDGKSSVLQIANDLDLPFEEVYEFVDRMRSFQLVRPVGTLAEGKI